MCLIRGTALPRQTHRGGFQPPCCPNPQCRFHLHPRRWRFAKRGFRPARRGRSVVQEYYCTHCGRRFSATSFRTDYWLRRPELLLPIARLISEGAGLRQIARALGTSHTTVARQVARLGRHCLLFHGRLVRRRLLTEPLVIDGFESFEFSQYFPFHANLAVGARSWLLYHFTDSPLRRKGAMTPFQKQRRAELERLFGRPDPQAVERGVAELLRPLLSRVPPGSRLCLHSDDHPAYHRALRRLKRQSAAARERVPIQCQVTSSKERRTTSNPLFPVNLADLLLRHSNANHRRETIAFSKRRQAAIERLAVFCVWRNYVKRRREKGRRESAGMWLGLVERMLDWREILRRRLFPGPEDLPGPWADYYWRRVPTVALGSRQTRHVCRYAF
jgi:transposase-like protein